MQQKSSQNNYIEVTSLSDPHEKPQVFKKMTQSFIIGQTIQGQKQKEYTDFDQRGVIDYDDLSKQSNSEKYLNFAKIIQKKRAAQKQLQLVNVKFKAQIATKQTILLQLQRLAKYKQIQEDSTKTSLQYQRQNIKNQIFYQEELKKGLQSELEAWKSLNRVQQEQINAFPHQIKSQLRVMQDEKQSLLSERQKINSLLALQDIFLGNIEQIMDEFP